MAFTCSTEGKHEFVKYKKNAWKAICEICSNTAIRHKNYMCHVVLVSLSLTLETWVLRAHEDFFATILIGEKLKLWTGLQICL